MPSDLTKADVIGVLRDISALLEYHGENRFKSRAYENAAQALANDPTTLDKLIQPKRLEAIAGIGKATAQLIREIMENGESAYHKQLKAGTPAGLYELIRIPTLSLKKIRTLHEKLGIESVEELENACKTSKLAPVSGFGEKTCQRILAGIEQRRKFANSHLFFRAEPAAVLLLEGLRRCPEVERVEIAGSVRRGNEVVTNIDIVASSASPQKVMDCFITLPGVVQVTELDVKKTTVLLAAGMSADLRVVADEDFACALHHFTGNREHNAQVSARAIEQGVQISEHGIFNESKRRKTPKKIASKLAKQKAGNRDEGSVDAPSDRDLKLTRLSISSEAEFFAALGLDYIPPALREGLGEVEAAAKHELPELITTDDYRGVLHCHSTWSDGSSTIREMALAACERGFEYIAICDHSEIATYAGGVKKEDLARQQEEIDRLNEELNSKSFRILKSCECDILADGSLDYPDRYLETMDLVVASIHSRFQMDADEMTRRLISAIENPYTTIIGHLSGRLLLSREPYKFDMEAVLERAAQTGTIIEINADPHRLDLDWRWHRHAADLGIRFAINPDAHSTRDFEYLHYGINIARKGWLTRQDVVNCLELEAFLKVVKSIRRKKL